MNLIHMESDVTESIEQNGFAIVQREQFCINGALIEDMHNLSNYYNFLEIDEYILQKEKKQYRKRRYGSYMYDVSKNKLYPNKHESFFQNENINSAYGGIERVFAPIEMHILNNSFLHEIIKADFSKLPLRDRKSSDSWFVGVHLFRVETKKDEVGYATPEGVHQDGHDFVVQHMIKRTNISGGESTIYNLNKEEIESITLTAMMDSCFVNDKKVMHSVSEVKSYNDNEVGYRDMLILDFERIR